MSFGQAECKPEPLILLVIRNAQTRSHLRGWYVGSADEPLSLQGQSQVKFAAAEISAAGLHKRVLNLGAPDDFIEHARISQQRRHCGLTVEQISARILDALAREREEKA